MRTYGGASSDYGYSVEPISPDGGYIITGATFSSGAGSYDVYLIKTDADGEALWTKTYGGTDSDYGYSARQTLDGGYIIAGYTNSSGAGSYDFLVIKTDSGGIADWAYTYGGGGDDRARFVQQTLPDSGYVIAGYTESFGAGGGDAYLLKIDADGGYDWGRTYGGLNWDEAWCVRQTFPDGGYVIAGATSSSGAGMDDVYLVKADTSGYVEWEKTYGGGSPDYGRSVQQTLPDSGYIIAGYTSSSGAGSDDVYLVKTDANGDTIWTRTYGGTSVEQGHSVRQTYPDNGYIIAGSTRSSGAGSYDAYVIKTTGQGDVMWANTYGGTEYDDAYCALQTSGDSSYVIVGSTRSFGAGVYDVWLIKTEPVMAGVPERPQVDDIVLTSRGLPNPFGERTLIEYYMSRGSNVRVAIYSVLGREVRSLIDMEQTAGRHTTVWDGRDNSGQKVASGLYVVRVEAGHSMTATKLLLVR
jgi:hypothetical protein